MTPDVRGRLNRAGASVVEAFESMADAFSHAADAASSYLSGLRAILEARADAEEIEDVSEEWSE